MRLANFGRVCGAAVVTAGLALYATPASASAIITNGSGIYLGVDNLGQLNIPDGTGGVNLTPSNSGFVGLYFAAVDGDGTSPGCLCEGFGVSVNGTTTGFADNATGIGGLTGISFVSTASTATAVVGLNGTGLTVSQDYHPSTSSALYEVTVTLTNTGATTLNDVRYNRTMDWDIPPTTFSELVTLQGWPATALICTGDDGFQSPDPLLPCDSFAGAPVNSNFTDSGPADHGARFTFGFGSLAAGESVSFKIYYGATPTEAGALAALGAVGAEVYSFGQCNAVNGCDGSGVAGSPATFIFAFSGVGGTAVPTPEPTSMILLGLGGAGAYLRRRFASKS